MDPRVSINDFDIKKSLRRPCDSPVKALRSITFIQRIRQMSRYKFVNSVMIFQIQANFPMVFKKVKLFGMKF